ncbi:hypothetical protein PhCBS80983_g04791 [Powellomyces hirtus]|uniref:Uncharacterized protein n=1 Tax=Powellomyces hirtus TaxID=109895 RepID=A0A507DWI2_9FUNG|nr:hypothetical protein PhCBS80983_g04791 [Powellomyces hirtus]
MHHGLLPRHVLDLKPSEPPQPNPSRSAPLPLRPGRLRQGFHETGQHASGTCGTHSPSSLFFSFGW